MNNLIDDAELVARCKRELPYQHGSFEQLVKRYQSKVYTLCYRLTGEAARAEELMQEVFLKVYLNLKNFEERSSFSSWVYRITHNHCLNYLDKRRRERQGMATYTEEQQQTSPASIKQKFSEPMQEALDQLNQDQKSLLILKYVLELDLVEISQILDISTGAVKMRLLRAREEFKRLYVPN